MSDKLKICGIEWYDVKTKFKKIIRSILYSNLFQELICWIIFAYMKLIYHSSKIIFVNKNILLEIARTNQPAILSCWHHRLMMMPFITFDTKKVNPEYNFTILSSNHGDGQFVGKIIEKFGMINIHGSSKYGRKASRGIDIANFREIFRGLKNRISFGITPDGPRGPSQKINGQIINIAGIAKVPILPVCYSASKYIRLNSWDRFVIPLPFGKICYYFDELIWIDKDADKAGIEKILEEKMNLACKKADEVIYNDGS